MAGLINIGLTGLLSHQSALSTTGNNVTNANTAGYSRQQVHFETLPSHYAGSGYLGTGVTIADIQRMNSEFINQQLRNDTTLNGEQSVLAQELGRLDNLFASDSTGLNGALSEFFAAVHDAAESPSSIPQRQLLISRGNALAERFHTLANKLEQHRVSVEQQLSGEVNKVNSLAGEIAGLNLAIASSPGLGQGIQPNELLDQRDEKLRQLAELVPIQVTPTEGGQVNVYFGKGQALVNGTTANTLALDSSESPSTITLSTGAAGSGVDVTGAINGGRIGGLLTFRDEGLANATARLDNIANGLTKGFNEQHQGGFGLGGETGLIFFGAATDSSVDTAVPPDPANHADRQPGAAGIKVLISDPSQLALAGSDGENSLDNENALLLGDLASTAIANTTADPAGDAAYATLGDAYGLLVTDIGSETSRAQSGLEASSTLLDQSSNSWQSQSGVNLDEEAGNLIRYQAAYNASAQVVSVARDLFNTLLSSFR